MACPPPRCNSARLRLAARGGNAVDAALAAAITLTVVEPVMNGIGGDASASSKPSASVDFEGALALGVTP